MAVPSYSRIIVSDKIVIQPESIDPTGRNEVQAEADTLAAAIARGLVCSGNRRSGNIFNRQ
jgi:hypothetical protein